MSEQDKQDNRSRAVKKINVTGNRLPVGEAPIDIQKAMEAKNIAFVRTHNTRFNRKGTELLKVVNLVGLSEADNDELIGRLLFTQEAAKSDPERVKAWIAAGEALRLKLNPLDRAGTFSLVIQEVGPEDAAAAELVALGIKFNPRYASFEGKADLHEVLRVLAGTRAVLRVRVGRPKKGGDGYEVLLKDGKEVEGARAILLGEDSMDANDDAASDRSAPPAPRGFAAAIMTTPKTKGKAPGNDTAG
ncbi:conjugal transfer protein TraD [Devosia sp. XGJD_8]|uniref:conjugal transfer protein TraD n=1 Tax=Devosia sp. XGJD_8 TaxID=3391187 RepID=UPI003985599D